MVGNVDPSRAIEQVRDAFGAARAGEPPRAVTEVEPPQLGERRNAAAEDRVRARAVDDGNVVLREERDLLRVDLYAVGGDDSRRQEPPARERPDAAFPQRRRNLSCERLPWSGARREPLELVGALVQMGCEREVALETCGVELRRAGVGSMGRDAQTDAVGEVMLDTAAVVRESAVELRRVRSEDLEVDDRAQPEFGAGGDGGAAEAAVSDRGDARAQTLGRADPRNGDVLVPVDPALSFGVQPDPLREVSK